MLHVVGRFAGWVLPVVVMAAPGNARKGQQKVCAGQQSLHQHALCMGLHGKAVALLKSRGFKREPGLAYFMWKQLQESMGSFVLTKFPSCL